MAELAHLARPGATFAVRVTPRAGRDALLAEPGLDAARAARSDPEAGGAAIRIHVTAPPEDGRATAAARALLARALGVAPSRLSLLRGATSREKLFRLD